MKTYFAAFIPSGDRWAVLFADFELATQGDTPTEAFAAAQEALRGRVQCMVEDGEPLPEPSDLTQARSRVTRWCNDEGLPLPTDTLFQLIPCEEFSTRLVRVNVSFPQSVLERIDAKAKLSGMSRSGFLAAAAGAFEPVLQ
ncbi:MAG: type II toxin-antitoxin system HicB family antitoxin [Desulfovibrio sp.]|nr:type II toxin-antitoxin system HicB family antitoxin [Desulfovibrio sp.]